MKYPTCKSCGAKMTEYDGWAWYTCPVCGDAIRDNGDGSWTWKCEIVKFSNKKHMSDFELANFCHGGDLTED